MVRAGVRVRVRVRVTGMFRAAVLQ